MPASAQPSNASCKVQRCHSLTTPLTALSPVLRAGTFPLTATSHLLTAARTFLGGSRRISGDEMNNRTDSAVRRRKNNNSQTCMHRREMEDSKSCSPCLLNFKAES